MKDISNQFQRILKLTVGGKENNPFNTPQRKQKESNLDSPAKKQRNEFKNIQDYWRGFDTIETSQECGKAVELGLDNSVPVELITTRIEGAKP